MRNFEGLNWSIFKKLLGLKDEVVPYKKECNCQHGGMEVILQCIAFYIVFAYSIIQKLVIQQIWKNENRYHHSLQNSLSYTISDEIFGFLDLSDAVDAPAFIRIKPERF